MPNLALVRPPRGLAAVLAVTALSLAACGGGGSDPAPALAATVSPAAPAIWDNQPLRITFNASMNTGSLEVSGTLASPAPLASWSTSAVANDTLVLTPNTLWTVGDGAVTVKASDGAGRALTPALQASYTVKAFASCGPSAGACNSATDCDFTVTQLATWTQTCFISNGLNAAKTSTCVQRDHGVTAGCADCTSAMARCGFENCAAPCSADPAGAACIGCVATFCADAFVTCAGRTITP
jgi:hypothetical protein